MAGVATFNFGAPQPGIPISGNIGPSQNFVQNAAPTSDQYLGGNITSGSKAVLGDNNGAPPPPAPDPYAQWGGQTAYNNKVSGFDTQDQNIFGTSRDAANSAALGRHSSILDFLDSLRSGQNAIDEQGVQNELGKLQGRQSITDMVGRGLKSGGTLLSNRNALSSSAAEAIARAYGEVGGREMNNVNNGYELENRNIGMKQDDFNRQRGTGLRKFGESEQQSVTDITSQARDRLAQLDAAMVDADMPTRYAIEQQRQQIQSEVGGILGQFDTELNNGANGVQATSTDARRQTAFGMNSLGKAATNPFDFSTQIPAQFQNTGPFGQEFPLFGAPNKRVTA